MTQSAVGQATHTLALDVKGFYDALELSINAKGSTIPVIEYVRVSCEAGRVFIESTDLDRFVITELDGEASADGSFLVPRKKSLAVLKGETGTLTIFNFETIRKMTRQKTPAQWVNGERIAAEEEEYDVTDSRVKLSIGDCEFEFESLDVASFPVFPEVPEPSFHMSAVDLKPVLQRTLACVCREESRFTLQGALFNVSGGIVHFVGTDGHRMSVSELEPVSVRNRKAFNATGRAIIPRDALDWLVPKIGSGDVAIAINTGTDKDRAAFRLEELNTTLLTKQMEGQFPNYEAVLPRMDQLSTVVTLPPAHEFSKTLARVAKVADERTKAIMFEVNGKVEIRAKSTENGSASANISGADISRTEDAVETVTIGFSADYFQEFLKTAGKNPVKLSIRDGNSAVLLEVPGIFGYKYVLMPMRV